MDKDAHRSLLSIQQNRFSAEVLEGGNIMLNVGDQAPDFTVMAHDGKPVTLSALRGSKVLLWFYPKADTPG
jgi:peroxiredoxin